MDKKLFSLLIAPTLLFSWDHASANEPQEYITDSSDQGQGRRSSQGRGDSGSRGDQGQSRGSSQGRGDSGSRGDQGQGRGSPQVRDDSGSRGDQRRGGGMDSQKQQPQTQQPQMTQPRIQQPQIQQPQTQQRNQESGGMKSGGGGRDRNQKRDIDQKKDDNDQNQRNLETEKQNQQSQERKSRDRNWDRNKQRDIEQKRDSTEQRWDGESDKRDAVKTRPGGFGDGDKDRQDYRGERISKERFKEKENRWQSKSKEWRKRFSDNRSRDHIFDDHFWDHFRRKHSHWYFDNNFQWYTGTTWPRVVIWLPWQWNRPIYYYYETNGDVYYSATEDFSYLIPVDSKEVFIAQAARIANARYPISEQQSDWLPLGMFTFGADNDSSDMPKRYISLAISKMGAVSGAYFDAANNTTLEIQGGIDPESQRIAWKFVGNDWPIMESGLYNLTKEESTLLIHTSNRTTETQLLIRLDR